MLFLVGSINSSREAVHSRSNGYVVPASAPAPSGQVFIRTEISDNLERSKNPDIAELVRGKTGRVYGSLMSMLTTMKGIPLAYNKDMQEDKEGTFDAIDTVKECLMMFTDNSSIT